MISPQTPRVRSCTTVLGSDSRRLFYRGQRRGVFALQVTLGGAGGYAVFPRLFARFGAATAIAWAIGATFIKATTDTISAYGVIGSLAHWPIYAFVVGGIIGLLCEQTALHVGPLGVSQPFIVIVDPIVSVILGVWLYHEQLQVGAAHVTIGAVGFAVMCVGIVAMTQTAPPSLSADVRRI